MITFAHLPYDIILDIIYLLPSRDLVHLLSCCRRLYALVQQEPIWRQLSAPYGLHDIANFGGRSWYAIYTRLLHPYGPMLGLWAGDNAYSGGILEVRLDAGNERTSGGIAIDLWQFRMLQPEELDGPEMTELPAYKPVARIDFSATPRSQGDPRVTCCAKRPGVTPKHPATIELFSPTYNALFIHTRGGQYPHPEFPGPDLAQGWVDRSRYPNLPCRQSLLIDQGPQLAAQRPRIPIVYAAPSSLHKPHAISISCSQGCLDHLRPFLGFDSRVPYLPRYYPLRATIPSTAHIPPMSPDWDPKSLTGLWLGSHGPHGTECLYLDLDRATAVLSAWKITGDENVPRGALSWEANMGITCSPSIVPSWAIEHGVGDPTRCRLFQGTGVISARGYFPHQSQPVAVVLAVEEPDLLRMLWTDMSECSVYARYKGRGRRN